ncbi:VQ motif-containing protein 9 [Sesamum alatum]|uniref:VQ motif-containing protein 9 n=1 Tax=Sesamum alatum TaxID=300844 RepID=A0AAE1YR52_9LAMI|nr:VQ motif-containing protein 9 [Sesamum alatum]
MDKGFGNDSNSNSSSRDMFLKQVNKNSHQIAKPVRKPPTSAAPILDLNPRNPGPTHPQSQQPPVYNINKNDFRDVVQRLTGSPAHERFPPQPPPVTQPRPPSSRLQRIRPPPLPQITNRPPQLVPHPQNDAGQRGAAQPQPFQPLPPLPSVHPPAESPISAYMRFLQSSASSPAPSPLWNRGPPIGPRPDSLPPQSEFGQRAPFSPLPPMESPVSAYMRFLQSSPYASSAPPPRGNGLGPPPPQPPPVPPHQQPPQQQPPLVPPQQPPPPAPPSSSAFPSPFPAMPLSPLPFGWVPSPRSPYGMLSPSFLFSPAGQFGLPQVPLSPTLPVPSPRWKGM